LLGLFCSAFLAAGACIAAGATALPTDDLPMLFDPARHMRVSEVRPGMTGYGLSVFQGTKIERFDVEVVSILKNFNPKYDVILIRCHGANLEHTGAIAGMSGSPIYLRDDAGRDRMIGAFAYGWPLQKDPVAGVQPIEYMLRLPEAKGTAPATQPLDGGDSRVAEPMQSGARSTVPPAPGLRHSEDPGTSREMSGASEYLRPGVGGDAAVVRNARWSLDEAVLLPGMTSPPRNYPLASWDKFTPNPRLLSGDGDAARLQPLATPLMTAGLPANVLRDIEPVFRAYDLVPLQAGAGGSPDTSVDPAIEPGSVLAVPLLSGDVDLSAVGTCTERIGNHVLAFGHAFNNEGPVSLPMGAGSIQGIIANFMTSFKLGSLSRVSGTLTTDQTVGIAGVMGGTPPSVPIDLRVKYADGSEDQTYHFESALHPKLTPLLSAVALSSALSGSRELPQYHTIDYDLNVEFNNGKRVHIVNTTVNASVADLFFEIGVPLIAASDNPFERVLVKKIDGTMIVTPEAREGQILYANVPRSRYRPGETVTAYVTYRPFRAGEMVLPVTLELPRDLPDGTYQLTISDWQKFLADERTAEPFKFTAETIDQVFDVLRDVSSVRHSAVYIRLLRQPDGIAIGHTAMPKLPSSVRQVMIGAGRSDTTQFVSSAVKVVPTPRVMSGSADFEITIDKNANTEVASPAHAPPHRDVRPQAKPADAAPATPTTPPKSGKQEPPAGPAATTQP
jgi:hypothetical protein